MTASEQLLFYDVKREELAARLQDWGQPSYRAQQIWQAVYQQYIMNPEQMTTLPKALREQLHTAYSFTSLVPLRTQISSDGETRKTLYGLSDDREIETVLMRYDERRTVCISTQSGCGMGCSFCATGQMGFQRNLTSGEIVEQVMVAQAELQQQDERLTNIVLMGMGEPFANYDAVMEAIDRLHDPQGTNFGERRFTISTVGLVPEIIRFAGEQRQINLAVSLHAATDELRSEMMPINRRYGLDQLMDACRTYVNQTSRRITFEWALIHGVNDDLEQADAFLRYVRGLRCHVNLIPLNPTRGYAAAPSEQAQVEAFQRRLLDHRVPCTIRLRRGIDIQAGCGQLVSKHRGDPPK